MKPILAALTSALLISACVEGTPQSSAPADPLTKALSGKTIVSDTFQATLGANGSLNGKAANGVDFVGAWTVRNGQFCRTFTEPESFVGTECQNAELGDGTVTITGRSGPIEFQIR